MVLHVGDKAKPSAVSGEGLVWSAYKGYECNIVSDLNYRQLVVVIVVQVFNASGQFVQVTQEQIDHFQFANHLAILKPISH